MGCSVGVEKDRGFQMTSMETRYTSLTSLIDMAKNDPDNFIPLTEYQKHEMVRVFGHRCRIPTKKAIYNRLSSLSTMFSYGIYTRVAFFADGTVRYITGQDYDTEIRTVRQCILENR